MGPSPRHWRCTSWLAIYHNGKPALIKTEITVNYSINYDDDYHVYCKYNEFITSAIQSYFANQTQSNATHATSIRRNCNDDYYDIASFLDFALVDVRLKVAHGGSTSAGNTLELICRPSKMQTRDANLLKHVSQVRQKWNVGDSVTTIHKRIKSKMELQQNAARNGHLPWKYDHDEFRQW